MTCAEARLRYLWISLVLIYLIKMWIWHVLRLDTDADLRQFQDRYDDYDYNYIIIWNAYVRDVGSHGFPDPH